MADTADTQEEPTSIDLDKQRQRLLDMQQQLQQDIDNKAEQVREGGDDLVPERGGISNHIADDADEVVEQENMMAIQRSAERQLDLVNSALQRLDDGTYGTCANCGKPISPARLDALPWAMYDINCQQLADEGRL